MQPSRRRCLFASLALLVFFLLAPRAPAETLTIATTPPGATVEIDGMPVGPSPYTINYPGGYFHKPHTAFGSRLEHAIIARISMDGYLIERVTLTEGPFDWTAISGRRHGSYFLLKSIRFDIKLDPISYGNKNADETDPGAGPLRPARGSSAFQPPEAPANSAASSVKFASDPSGADIYVDGSFVGQTPSTIALPPGVHRLELKLQGRISWSRELELLPGSDVALHPVLAPSP